MVSKIIITDLGPILIMVQEDRTCYQIAELLSSTGYNIVHHHPHGSHPKIIERPDSNNSEFSFSSDGIESLFKRTFKNYLRWKGGLIQIRQSTNTSKPDDQRNELKNDNRKMNSPHAVKRRRLRGGSNMNDRKSKDLVFDIDAEAEEIHEL